jgi:ABC-type multidrug transport system ATPase subunit
LISSHLLSEIEKLVTHVGIINRGELLFQGTLPELVGKQRQSSFIVFETSDDSATRQIINDFGVTSKIEAGKIATPLLERETIARINRKLVESRVEVYQVSRVESDLERIFFDVIGE